MKYKIAILINIISALAFFYGTVLNLFAGSLIFGIFAYSFAIITFSLGLCSLLSAYKIIFGKTKERDQYTTVSYLLLGFIIFILAFILIPTGLSYLLYKLKLI